MPLLKIDYATEQVDPLDFMTEEELKQEYARQLEELKRQSGKKSNAFLSLVQKFNENHDELGRFAESDSSGAVGGTSSGGSGRGGSGTGSSTHMPTTEVLFEVAPDPNNAGAQAAWSKLGKDEQYAISSSVASEYVPKTLDEIGAKGKMVSQVGGYMGNTTASLAVQVDNPDQAIDIGKALGTVLSQDSIMVTSEAAIKGTFPATAFHIQLPKGATFDDVKGTYDKLYKLESNGDKLVGGHTTANGIMTVINLSNLSDAEFGAAIDKQLGNAYKIDAYKVNVAFLENGKDYSYAGNISPSGDASAGGQSAQGNLGALRDQASAKVGQLVQEKTKKANPFIGLILKFNENHDELGRFAESDSSGSGSSSSGSGSTASSGTYASEATPEYAAHLENFISEKKNTEQYKAVESKIGTLQDQTKSGDVRNWSKEIHADAQGNYTPERQALHDEIINSTLAPDTVAAEGTRPQVVLLIGQPGAGKTTAGGPVARGMLDANVNLATINADDVKAALPEYAGWNAAALHEESTDVIEQQMLPRAIEGRHNMLLDITGNNAKKMAAIATALGAHGYDVHVVDVSVSTHVSLSRVWDRFMKSGRFVPLDYAKAVDHRPDATYTALKSNPAVMTWAQVDNSGSKPVIVDKGHK